MLLLNKIPYYYTLLSSSRISASLYKACKVFTFSRYPNGIRITFTSEPHDHHQQLLQVLELTHPIAVHGPPAGPSNNFSRFSTITVDSASLDTVLALQSQLRSHWNVSDTYLYVITVHLTSHPV